MCVKVVVGLWGPLEAAEGRGCQETLCTCSHGRRKGDLLGDATCPVPSPAQSPPPPLLFFCLTFQFQLLSRFLTIMGKVRYEFAGPRAQ